MPIAQANCGSKVFLHPTICTSPTLLAAFQQRTGLKLIISPAGQAHAVSAGGAA